MVRFKNAVSIVFICCLLAACDNKKPGNVHRPKDIWFFRSVLDLHPRMLTLALDSQCYIAYDLAHSKLYRVWKGGVTLEGAAYTDKKNLQPTSWGTSYVADSVLHFEWIAERDGKNDLSRIVNRGYAIRDNRIYLKFELLLLSGDTIRVEEHPEFIRSETGRPGLERLFKTSGIPGGVTVSLKSRDSTLTLNPNKTTRSANYFNNLPAQFRPKPQEESDHRGRYWMEKSDCFTCHEVDQTTVGPSLNQIALRYQHDTNAAGQLIAKVKNGGTGVWGGSIMNAHPNLTDNEIRVMLSYVLSLKPKGAAEPVLKQEGKKRQVKEYTKPGFGAALEGMHPSYDLSTIRKHDFRPRVGGLAFLPDGRLLVTTWDAVGGVYLLDGVETGDTSKITVKRIASGLAEPLGIAVADGEIFVLQKQELTRLIDLDGDDIIDEYQAICNTWGVSADFHEFAFGLVYKEGYFYITLSMAMRLMSDEKQKPDRGKTLKISKTGSYEWINYGLRTPNGIGRGVDGELFVTDNQGEWIPANKLIHVKKGDYHGMPWGLSDPHSIPPTAAPAIWLPEDEIANSPSEPVLMQDGPYKGQMLHGDVTHGGIKRDFLEKINGAYQGAVFRFSQGLEAGVNRLRWGPDGALYVGGVGMVGGWSWKEKQYGLQRMKYNGKITFEMLAVRAKPGGFEIELTKPLDKDQEKLLASHVIIQQWGYLPTENYGGPKIGLEKLKVARLSISKDQKTVSLEIPGLKKARVVYFRLPDALKSADGQLLWSSEAWYTMNNMPNDLSIK